MNIIIKKNKEIKREREEEREGNISKHIIGFSSFG